MIGYAPLLFFLVTSLAVASVGGRDCSARTLVVGAGFYNNLRDAASAATVGDTIEFTEGVFPAQGAVYNLHGGDEHPIVIRARTQGQTIIRGGSQAFHLVQPRNVKVVGLTFEQQSANGVNVDDGGTFTQPATGIHFDSCTFRDMDATDNNDLLKISGVEAFYISNCTFLNGSPDGSMIDMVGCHFGRVDNCTFTNAGSNCIQMKGGTSDILIERCHFVNGGHRSLNIGGSTGLDFFRPQNAPYEASRISVFSCVFQGSATPFGFVGAVDCKVVNNTILYPTTWAFRILQETTGERFEACGRNAVVNNIFVVDNNLRTAVNIGPNTNPESFTISHNLWYHADERAWQGPSLPVVDPGQIVNRDPLFREGRLALISPTSPAVGAGKDVEAPTRDFYGIPFRMPRTIGAVEWQATDAVDLYSTARMHFNHLAAEVRAGLPASILLFHLDGRLIAHVDAAQLDMVLMYPGNFFGKGAGILCISSSHQRQCTLVVH